MLGAAAGAGVNVAFLGYYRDMAHVRFGLMRLAGSTGPTRSMPSSASAMARPIGD